MASTTLVRVFHPMGDVNAVSLRGKPDMKNRKKFETKSGSIFGRGKYGSKVSSLVVSNSLHSDSENGHFRLSPPEFSSILFSLLGSLAGPAGAARAEDLDDVLNNLDGSLTSAAASAADYLPLILGGVAILSVPLAISFFANRKGYAGDVKATDAFVLLENDDTFLVDIRSKKDKDTDGYPSLQSLRKKPISIVFEIDESETESDSPLIEDAAFAEKFSSFKNVSEQSTILLIDGFGKISPIAAKALTKFGYKKVYVVLGGTDGPLGWRESELPWKEPFRINLNGIVSAASSINTKEVAPVLLTLAAAAGLSVAILTEAEIVLQLLGSAAVLQFLLKKFVFSEDRKRTIEQIKAFVEEQVAPAEIVDDLKGLGAVLLPETPPSASKPAAPSSKAETAVTEISTPPPPVAEVTVSPEKPTQEPSAPEEEKDTAVFASPQILPEPSVPSVSEQPQTDQGAEETNGGAAKSETEVVSPPVESSIKKSTDLPPSPTPLSPYTMYPDLKPPTSPTPKPPESL